MKIITTLLAFALILLLLFCTDNPFFGDDPAPNLKLKGKVTLEDEKDFSNIFVWLRGINVKTKTKKDGSFALQLPNPQALPGGAFAWNRDVALYYYMVNFKIDSVMISLFNGKLEQDQKNVTNSGWVNGEKQLQKEIQISSTCEPERIDANDSVWVSFNLKIEKRYFGDTLSTYISRGRSKDPDTLRAFYLFRADDPLGTYKKYIVTTGKPFTGFINQTLEGENKIKVMLAEGEYKIVPFVNLIQRGIPAEMFFEMDAYPGFTEDFLKLPMTYESQILTAN
jgi:hypothetical protein